MTNQEQYELICEKAEKYDRLVGMLDKIRAEIEDMQIVYDKSANYKDERTDEEKANDFGKMYKVLVLSIIDKYKAEGSEE